MLIDFVGNGKVLSELENNIINNDLSHSYLFLGSEGVGKYTAAKAFARRILCSDENVSCSYVENFTHPDLKIIRGDKSIKKQEIEEIVEESFKMPYEASNKIFIIDGFDLVTTEGQNAMLKTLEEPQSYLKFILIANNIKKVLPTIQSRARLIKFKDVSNLEIENFLINKEGIDRKNASLFAKISTGSIKRAIRYGSDPYFLSLRDKSIEVLDRLLNIKTYPFREYGFFDENKEELAEIFNTFILMIRDICVYSYTKDENLIINTDKIGYVKKQNMDVKSLVKVSETIVETKRKLENNTNFELTIEQMLIVIGGIK